MNDFHGWRQGEEMLKFRYATYLFGSLALLAGFATVIIIFLQKEWYLGTASVAVMLYPTMYLVGRKMTKVFLLLSCVKYMKNNNGSITRYQYENYIRTCLAKRLGSQDVNFFLEDVIKTLLSEKLIEIEGDSIMLASF